MTPVSHTLTSIDERGRKGLLVLEKTGARAFGDEAKTIAKRFVAARQAGEPLPAFPGHLAARPRRGLRLPGRRDRARGRTRSPAGRSASSASDAAAVFKQDRLAGPIFSPQRARGSRRRARRFPGLRGRFAAVEAEFLLRLGRDAPPEQERVDAAQDAASSWPAVHVGVETAGSPLATINDLGPAAIVADFGNNAGLIVGPELPRLAHHARRALAVRDVRRRRERRPRSCAASPPGGPFESLRFLLELLRAALAAAEGRRLGVDRRDHGRARDRRRTERSRLVRRRRRGSAAAPSLIAARASPRTRARW